MSSISSPSAVGNQIPIPPSINQDASNPASDLSNQKNLAEATNAVSTTSNVAGGGESFLKGVISNLNPNLSPTTKV